MVPNDVNYLFYWTLYIGALPLAISIIAYSVGKYLTIAGNRVTLRQARKFSLCMLLISVSYFLVSILINTVGVVQRSNSLSKYKENIHYGVYINDELLDSKELVAQYTSILRKTSEPGSSIYDSSSPYLIQNYGNKDNFSFLSGVEIRQFDATKYKLKDSDCGPINPEFSDTVAKGLCKVGGKTPEGNDIYVMYQKVIEFGRDRYDKPDRFVPTDLITTYGDTRISLEDDYGVLSVEQKIKVMQSFNKVELKNMNFFNFIERENRPKFWMPSLVST